MNKSLQATRADWLPAPSWKLSEAKAKFSEVVRLAVSGQPQRVTVHGKDAVVVVAADVLEALWARERPDSLHDLLSKSPLSRITFGEDGVRSPVREIEC